MNVLVTRPDQRGKDLVDMLANAGIFAIHQPLFQLEAGRDLPQLPSALARLNSGDLLFAVSKHAIDFAHRALKEVGFSWRSDLLYFAVGQRSAHYFAAHTEQPVRYPIHSENSEGLLELPEMQHLTGKKILILRADSGRELFAEQAAVRGAEIQLIECYQRILPTTNLSEQISLSKRAGVDTVLATSVDLLQTLVEQTAENERDWLLHCRLITASSRISQYAKQLGWQSEIRQAKGADNHSLFAAITADL